MTRNITVIGMLALMLLVIKVEAQNLQDTTGSKNQQVTLDARVDPASLGLNFTLQMANYPQRQGSLPVVMRYSSKVWNIEFRSSWYDPSLSATFTATEPVYKNGWNMSLDPPRIEHPVWEAFGGSGQRIDLESGDLQYGDGYWRMPRLKIYTSDGVAHEMRRGDWIWEYHYAYSNNPNIWTGDFYSVDGSKMRYNVEAGTLYLSDGSRYVQDLINGNPIGALNTYVDKSGNVQKFVSNAWVDTMGRNIPHPYVNMSPSAEQDVNYSLPGIDTKTLDFIYKWKKLEDVLTTSGTLRHSGNCAFRSTPYSPSLFEGSTDAQSADVCGSELVFNPIVLNEIVLPNGTSYKFTYNIYGEIDKIVYPTGAYERFQYDDMIGVSYAGEPYNQANRGVTDRWISSDGNSGSEVHWQYESTYSSVSTIDPSGSKSERFYQYSTIPTSLGFEDSKTGKLLEEKIFDSSQNLIKRSLYAYESTGAVGPPPFGGYAVAFATRDTRPVREVSILFENGNSSALASMGETVYDTSGSSDPGYFSSLNAKQSKTYNYVVVSASTAASANITAAAAWFSTSDLANTTETDFLYDSNYKARNICGLATETRLKDSTGAVKAKNQISYDEGGYGVTSSGTMPTVAANSWTDPLTELGSTIGAKRGLPTSVYNYYDIANSYYVETHAFYDQFGNTRKSRDGRGNDAETLYDDDYAFAYPTSVITPIPDSAGVNGSSTAFTTSRTYDYGSGLALTATDANSQTTTLEYDDPLLRQTKVTAPNGTETITEYGAGTGASTNWVKVKSQIDATNWKQGYQWYDGLGRTIRTQTVDAEDGDVFALTCYDNIGRVAKASNPFRGWTTQDCTTTSGMEWTTNAYDTTGRPWKVTTPDTAYVETTYGLATSGSTIGTVVTVADQAGKLRRSVTNALGQLKRVDEPNSSNVLGAISGPNQYTSYAYDTLNNLTTVSQGSQTRTFGYDALSRLKQAVNPESGTINYTYDANGNLATKIDARTITTTYTYDRLNRVTLRDYSDSTKDVSYYYDNLTNAKGKLLKVSSDVSTTEYTGFDILGRVTAHKQTTDGNDYTTGYTYNLSGALMEETYPSGRVVKNVLDGTGELEIVQSKKNSSAGYWNYAENLTYNPAGAVISIQLGNGHWESTTFNSRLQPTQIALGTTGASTLAYDLLKLNYTFGTTANNGNVLTQTIKVPTVGANTGFEAVQTYTYDSLNRLNDAVESVTPTGGSASQSWKQTFIYDRYGNRRFDEANTSMPASFSNPAVSNPTVSTTTNRVTSSGYTYDNAGNTTADAGGQSYTYDAENKMVTATNGGGTLGQYSYDGDGKRVKKVVPGTGETTIFVYDAAGKQVAEYSTIVETTNAQVAYLTSDHLGSPRINTDQNGAVITRHDYHPFGEEIGGTGGRTTGLKYGDDPARKQFTGYERDNETNLDFAQARMYGNSHGRFTSPDPTLLSVNAYNAQSWNRYTYVLNNPYLYTDPLGLWEIYYEDRFKDKKNKDGTITKVFDRREVFARKTKDGDDGASLAKQLGLTGKDATKFADKIGGGDSIQLSKQGGDVGRVFNAVEDGLTDQAKFDAKSNVKELNAKEQYGNTHSDCSRTACQIGLGQFNGLQVGTNVLDPLLATDAKNVAESAAQVGDIIRYAKADNVATHFANFIFRNDDGTPIAFSKSGEKGAYEIRSAASLQVPNYGTIRGRESDPSGYYRRK